MRDRSRKTPARIRILAERQSRAHRKALSTRGPAHPRSQRIDVGVHPSRPGARAGPVRRKCRAWAHPFASCTSRAPTSGSRQRESVRTASDSAVLGHRVLGRQCGVCAHEDGYAPSLRASGSAARPRDCARAAMQHARRARGGRGSTRRQQAQHTVSRDPARLATTLTPVARCVAAALRPRNGGAQSKSGGTARGRAVRMRAVRGGARAPRGPRRSGPESTLGACRSQTAAGAGRRPRRALQRAALSAMTGASTARQGGRTNDRTPEHLLHGYSSKRQDGVQAVDGTGCASTAAAAGDHAQAIAGPCGSAAPVHAPPLRTARARSRA